MIVFVLFKDKQIKVVRTSAKVFRLEKQGWRHVNTIDPCIYIENLYNLQNLYNVKKKIRQLTKITHIISDSQASVKKG